MTQQKPVRIVLIMVSLMAMGFIFGGSAVASPPIQSADDKTTGNQIESTKYGWTQYTNGNYVRDIAVDDDGILWAATGGGVIAWNPATDEAIVCTRTTATLLLPALCLTPV